MNDTMKSLLIALLVITITCLHYFTQRTLGHEHVFYQGLYFLPIILASFWYGMKGGLATSLTITILYLPFMIMYWRDFSVADLNRIINLTVYNVVAVVLGYLRDREEKEHARMLASESLAAMGRAISSVVHDMKTPLIAIGGFTNLVKKKLNLDDPDQDKLDVVIRETKKLEAMVKDMLVFARPLGLNKSRENLNDMVRENLPVLDEVARLQKIKLETELFNELPDMQMDRMRMEQVLVNLVGNAIQASLSGQTVTVRSHHDDSSVFLEVIDCGCGIPPEKKEEIFTPFFSMKKEGTGLGLANVKKIVEAHGGSIEVISDLEHGTTFKVRLPSAGAGKESLHSLKNELAPPHNSFSGPL